MNKFEYQIKKYAKRYLRPFGVRRIHELAFWLTHRCVYSCGFCILEKNGGAFLPKERVFSLIEQSMPYELDSIQLTGGDPMLHPDFWEICDYIHSKKLKIIFHVTGRLLKEDDLKRLQSENKIWTWCLTLVSHRPELHDKYRAEGAFDDMVRAAALLKKYGQKLSISVNIVPETIDRLKETIAFAFDEMEPDSVSTEPIAPYGRAAQNPSLFILDDEQLYHYYCLMTELIPYHKKLGRRLEPVRAINAGIKYCESVFNMMAANIHPEGNVNPCCYLADSDGKMADINDGIVKATSLSKLIDFEKRLEKTHCNVDERLKKVGVWSCTECVRNFQVYVKGRSEFKR